MPAVIAKMEQYYNAFEYPPTPWHMADKMRFSVTVVVPGQQWPGGAYLDLEWGTSPKDMMSAARAFASQIARDQLGVDVLPDQVIMFGGPTQTLADLGG